MVWWLHCVLLLLSPSSSPPSSWHCKWALLFMRLSHCAFPCPLLYWTQGIWDELGAGSSWTVRAQSLMNFNVRSFCRMAVLVFMHRNSCSISMISYTVSPGQFTDVLSPPFTGLNPVYFHCIVLFGYLCTLNVPPGFYFQADLLCALGFTMDSYGHTQTHPSFCILTFFSRNALFKHMTSVVFLAMYLFS